MSNDIQIYVDLKLIVFSDIFILFQFLQYKNTILITTYKSFKFML